VTRVVGLLLLEREQQAGGNLDHVTGRDFYVFELEGMTSKSKRVRDALQKRTRAWHGYVPTKPAPDR
jgi:hypothetical protein